MACEMNETSVILDCICVNGMTLIEYIDAADLVLSEQIAAALACCTTSAEAIALLQACCAGVQADITTLQSDIVALQVLITALQNALHPALTVTESAAPFSFVSTTQTLNVSKGLHVLLQGIVTDPLPSFLTVLGVAIVFETVSVNEGFGINGMSQLVAPYAGLYHISGALLMTGPTIAPAGGNASARLALNANFAFSAGGTGRAELGDGYLPVGVHQFWGVQGSTVRRLAAGDAIQLRAGQTSQNALPTRDASFGGMPAENYFEATWLGD